MTNHNGQSVSELLANQDLITKAIVKGARAAVLRQARAGLPVSTCQDGKVVLIPPAQILAEFDPLAPLPPLPPAALSQPGDKIAG